MAEENEFGFSLMSEREIKAKEAELDFKLQQVLIESRKQKAKLVELKEMIMPLLENLIKDPEKTYILWEDRVPKVKEFIDKINKHVEG